MMISIIMGSKSDYEVMKGAMDILDKFGIAYEANVLSAHRTLGETLSYVSTLEDRGTKVIIAGAGKAAHLPGVIAGHTLIPVVGVPIKTSMMGGMDSLLSIVQMPGGIPVATVGVNGALNAGLLASQMIAMENKEVFEKLLDYRREMKENVLNDNKEIKKWRD
ncbi:MAG: 5-(carboxyamino)imidazole ribonucleotide mutase [Firmicutes bacterium]|nr:5-(carboxyamino)imidazole ribonucleotide mutase [Bacillota bacterium]